MVRFLVLFNKTCLNELLLPMYTSFTRRHTSIHSRVKVHLQKKRYFFPFSVFIYVYPCRCVYTSAFLCTLHAHKSVYVSSAEVKITYSGTYMRMCFMCDNHYLLSPQKFSITLFLHFFLSFSLLWKFHIPNARPRCRSQTGEGSL